jgi:hypothetical protein
MKIQSSGISISITPWETSGFDLISLRLFEEIGGNISNGSASFEVKMTEAAVNSIYKQCTGHLVIEKTSVGGYRMDIDFFITRRTLLKNNLTIEFLCVKDNKFFTELVSLEHTDITEALNSLYPGKIDIRCASDIANDIPLIQFNETNHSFCSKLAYSFKKDIIFAFGWEGFMLKDRCGEKNSLGKSETVANILNNNCGLFPVIGGSGVEPMDPYVMKYDNKLYEKVVDPWLDDKYENITPTNLKTLKYYNNYISVGSNYDKLAENYLYNNYMMTNNMQVSLRVKSDVIPTYKLGDIVLYHHVRETTNPHRAYLVKTNELYFAPTNRDKANKNGGFFWVSTLVSLFDSNGNKYPWESDPTLNINEKGMLV